MPTEPQPPTLAEVVHRAAEVCDPDGVEDGVAQLLERFQDRDEPMTAVPDVESELLEQKGAIDPQDEDPAVMMATAVAIYLAHRRTELERDRDELLRLAARAEYDGNPPEPVAGWLEAEGISA
jgi:cell pole-organizing protein PopZ